MSITGEFLSDFSHFLQGTKQADAALDGLEQKAPEFEKAWSDASKEFDIKNFFTDPLGEASTAAEGFLKTLGPMGSIMAVGAAGMSAVAVAAFKLVQSTAAADAHIGDLVDQTGILAPEMSQLASAANRAGVDVDRLADGIFSMQRQMAEHPTQFADALSRVGISAREFNDLRMDEKFIAIARAISEQEDPLRRIRDGSDLLGRSYKELAPSLGDVASAMDDVKGKSPVITTADVEAAKSFEREWRTLKSTFKEWKDSLVRDVIPGLGSLLEFINRPEFQKAFGEVAANAAPKARLLAEAWREVKDIFFQTWPAAEDVNRTLAQQNTQIAANAAQMPNAVGAQRQLTLELAEHRKIVEADVKALKEWNEAEQEITEAGTSWRDTLLTINGTTAEAAKVAIEAGASQKAVATYYGLSEIQVKALAEALKYEQTVLKESIKIEREAGEALINAYSQYEAAVRAGSAATTQARIDDAWRAADQQILALTKTGNVSAETYAAIYATAQQKTNNIIADTLREDQYSKSHYEQLAAKAREAYTWASTHADEYTQERIDQLLRESQAADQALLNWQTNANAALTNVKGVADGTTDALKKTREAVDDMKKKADAWGFHTGGQLPDSGLADVERFGGKYLVDKRTGDIVQELERKYGAGGFLGYGPKGPAPWAPVFNVHGAILGTQDELAALVKKVLMGSYTGGGNLLPT